VIEAARRDGARAAALSRAAVRPLAVSALALFISACATLSEGECRDQDWYGIGADDGFDGAPASKIEEHRKACAEYGIVPDTEQYEVGRRDGLTQYCTVTRGFDIGRKGMQYGGGCPPGADREFLRGHSLGRRFNDVEEELKRIDNDLRMYRSQSTTAEVDDVDQRRMYSRIQDLEFQRSQLEAELRHLEWERQRL
jgi:hypothetical protein